VIKGAALTLAEAAAARKAERDIVVCGPVEWQNVRWARYVESQAGLCKRCNPHTAKAGPQALPHFQQIVKPPHGHSFFETATLKAS
jgi:hypothetical protein